MPEVELEYDVLTIDTCVFEDYAYALNRGYFKQLEQFKDSPAKFVLSDIVKREILKHISERVKDARQKIKKSLKLAKNELVLDETSCSQAKDILTCEGDDLSVAESRLQDFIDRTGCEIIDVDCVDVQELTDMYFNVESPFEASGIKKNEFPDALALLSLREWAEEHDKKILAVSCDNGWRKFADGCDEIDVLSDVGAAMAKFQAPNSSSGLVAALQDLLSSNEESAIVDRIVGAIENSVESAEIQIDANSDFRYDYDDVYSVYSGHEFCKSLANDKVNVELIRIETDRVVVGLEAKVTCTVECSFSFYVHDSIDHDDVPMGNADFEREVEFTTDLLVTLAGDFGDNLSGVVVDDVEVLESVSFVDFGYVRPNWGDDWDDELED